MNNNPKCEKKCLDCYHCEPRCIQSCRDCNRCTGVGMFSTYNGIRHPVPRDMLQLTRKSEMEYFPNSQSKLSEVQKSDKYIPKPMYCKTKKCLQRKTNKENKNVISNSDVGLCYFCNQHDIQKNRQIFPPDTRGQGTLSFSETGGEITSWSVL